MTRTALCTIAQVLQTAGFQNADDLGGDDIVTESIEEADTEVFEEWGNPPDQSTFNLDSTQTVYEFRVDNKKTYRVDLVIIRDDNNDRIEYSGSDVASESAKTYVLDSEYNTITFATETTGAYDGRIVEVQYTKNPLHVLARNKAALFLLEKTSSINAEEAIPARIRMLTRRVERIEGAMKEPFAAGSEDEKYYDPTRGNVIPQRRFRTY